jgi:hypothetical protein
MVDCPLSNIKTFKKNKPWATHKLPPQPPPIIKKEKNPFANLFVL